MNAHKPSAPPGRRPSSRPKSLGVALAKVTKAAYRRRGFAVADILTNWAAVVGDALAMQSCPESLTFPPEKTTGGTLKIRVGGAMALELQHLAPLVIQRINGYYGFKAVERLSFIQGPMPKRETVERRQPRPLTEEEERMIEDLVAGTSDEALRQSLLALGRSILGESGGPSNGPAGRRG